jgi:hypothetical protein
MPELGDWPDERPESIVVTWDMSQQMLFLHAEADKPPILRLSTRSVALPLWATRQEAE